MTLENGLWGPLIIGRQTRKQGDQVRGYCGPLRDDGCWTVAVVVKTVKSGFFLQIESARSASGLKIRERQE